MSPLYERSNLVSETMPPRVVGTVPISLLKLNRNERSLLANPKVVGIDPTNELASMYMKRMEDSKPSELGIVPVKEF